MARDEIRKPLMDPVTDEQEPLTEDSADNIPEVISAQERHYTHCAYILGLVGLCDAVEYGLIMPSLYQYLLKIEGHDEASSHDRSVYGAVIALFSVTSLCCKPIVGSLCDRFGFRPVYIGTIVVAIAGNLVYTFAGTIGAVWALFVGRALSGVGASNTSLSYAYVARVIPSKRRTPVMFTLGLSFPLGLVLGPAMNLVTHFMVFDVQLGNIHLSVNDENSPALLLAGILCILLLALTCKVDEPPPYHDPKMGSEVLNTEHSKTVCEELIRPGVLVCVLVVVSNNLYISTTEAILVPVSTTVFDFTPLENSYVYGGAAVLIIALTIFAKACLSNVPDRNLVLFAAITYSCGSVAAGLLWTYDMTLYAFIGGQYLMLLSVPFVFSPNRSIFSKLIEGSVHQGLLSSLLSVFASAGSILGPLYMGVTLGPSEKSGPIGRHTFEGLWGLVGFNIITIFIIWWCVDVPIARSEVMRANAPAGSKQQESQETLSPA